MKLVTSRVRFVLILILLDVSLGDSAERVLAEGLLSLNPYSTGCQSRRTKTYKVSREKAIVLILILLDVSLGANILNIKNNQDTYVLILILLDVSLGDIRYKINPVPMQLVLILILLDVSLGGIQK